MRSLQPSLVTPPSVPLVSLSEAKLHLRVDSDDDDDLIEALVAAAVSYLDGWSGTLGRCLVSQTWKESFSAFPSCTRLRLRLVPVGSITSVVYRDSSNVEQTLSSSLYSGPLLDAHGAYLALDDDEVWPDTYDRDDAVTVTYVAGYGAAASDVPQAIRQAALLMIGHWYENREAVAAGIIVEVPLGATFLLNPFRRICP